MNNEANALPNDEPAPEAVAETPALEAELAKAKDSMLRALADAENTRRRAERQAQDARVYAIDKFARDLLPIADTLGRALQAVSQQQRDAADEATRTLLDGIELTERSLLDVLARNGVKRVGARGETFNPNLHQAVAQTPSDLPSGAIIEVLQPGYTLGDRTLRAAMVQVSGGPAAGKAEGGSIDIKV